MADDDAGLDPFAPLGDGPAGRPAAADDGGDDGGWQPELPAPAEPPAAPRHPKHGVPAAVWLYRTADGRPLFAVARFDVANGSRKKEIAQLCYGTLRGRRGWHWRAPPAPRALYGLPGLAARSDAPVLVVEGEKAADAAAALFPDHIAVTWPGGCKAVSRADWTPLAGRAVRVWPDNDAAGRAAAADVVTALATAGAASVTVVDVPPEWPQGWDVADPLAEGVAAETLARMLAEAAEPDAAEPDGEPDAADGDRDGDALEIARLAALHPLAYDRERQAAADRLGVRVSTLDAQVEAARPKPEAADGRGVALTEVEPWPEPVGAAALLNDLAAMIRRHVVMSAATADCCALWIAHTWVHARFQHSPRLSVTSPVKRCGKSTLLDVLRATCLRPLKADNISASGVFRTVEALRPLTLLIDEADSFLGENEELRGILNSGFEASGEVVRVVEVRDDWQPIRFATFAPVALAGIGRLPGTLEDRALPVVLARKTAAETAVKLRARGARDALRVLARKLARWAADRARHLPADPAVPDAMGDREGDVAVPMLAIADDAGGGWPGRARRALLDVFGHRNATEGNAEAGALLLADIRAIFLSMSAVQMASEDIIERLGGMEDRPWPEWRHGKPMTKVQLARALAPFGIRPATIRQGDTTPKGYRKEAFEEAWERYLPSDTPLSAQEGPSDPQHRHNQGNSGTTAENQGATQGVRVAERKSPKAAENLHCGGVADENPPVWGEGGCDRADDGWSAEL
jgi:hypothetical protein